MFNAEFVLKLQEKEAEFAFSVSALVANSVKQFTGLAPQLERGV